MGWVVEASGWVLAREKRKNDIIRAFEKALPFCEWCEQKEENETVSFAFYYSENYHEEDWDEFTSRTACVISDGLIEFCSEDHSHWRLRYENGRWLYEDGYVVFENDLTGVPEYVIEGLRRGLEKLDRERCKKEVSY